MKVRRLLPLILASVLTLAACAPSPSPTPSPTASVAPTRTPVAPTPTTQQTPAAEPANDQEVTFTFDCAISEDPPQPSPPRIQFDTLEEAWATDVPLLSCESIKHGTVYTDVQRRAVEVAAEVLPNGINQLDALYSQCAMRDNGYLAERSPLASNQAADVRGFLTLCPDHPAADELRAKLPS